MSGRVLSTEQAKSAIAQMQAIVDGGLAEQISPARRPGQGAVQPGRVGRPAGSAVPRQHVAADPERTGAARQELDALREQLQQIAQNIMPAGGNA